MPKIRLTRYMRDKVISFAYKSVKPKSEFDALAKAFKAASPVVRKMVEVRFPTKDMKVCLKYGVAFRDDCIRIQLVAGGVVQFKFEDDTGPYVVSQSCQTRMFIADEVQTALIEEWRVATETYESERERRITAYRSMINAARYAEEIINVWPEAASVMPAGQEIIAVNADVIALIKSDVSERAA